MKVTNLLSKNSFNAEWANTHSKAEFVKQHEHLADAKTLEAEWDKLQKEKKDVKK